MDSTTRANVKYTFNSAYVFFHELCRYVAMDILDTSKNVPIIITGMAAPENTTDSPITL